MEGLIEGRIVHYVPNGWEGWNFPEEHRPAIVVKVWPGGNTPNLIVFVDGTNDMPPTYPGDNPRSIPAVGHDSGALIPTTAWRTSVPYSEEPKPGTWHWIEKA